MRTDEPVVISGISHVAIKVRDLEAAERFYCGVLGLAVQRRWPLPDGTGDRSLWLDTGQNSGPGSTDNSGAFLALEVADPPPAPEGAPGAPSVRQTAQGGHHLLALRIAVAERANFESRLAEAGVRVSHRTAFTIYFADPEGNLLGLSHYPDAHAHAQAQADAQRPHSP